MPDKYYSKAEINKRISSRLKPKPFTAIAERFRELTKSRKLPRFK